MRATKVIAIAISACQDTTRACVARAQTSADDRRDWRVFCVARTIAATRCTDLLWPFLSLFGAAAESSVLDDRDAFARLFRRRRRNRGRLDVGLGQRPRLAFERRVEHLLDPAHRTDLEPVLDLVGNLGEVLHVLLLDQHRLDPAAARREQLL